MKKAIFISVLLSVMLSGCGADDSQKADATDNIASISTTGSEASTDATTADNDISEKQKETLKDAAMLYSIANPDIEFETGDTLKIDDLMLFFCINYLNTDKSSEVAGLQNYPIEINKKNLIPKTVVNDFLESIFEVKIDSSNSEYYSGTDSDKYYVETEVRGESYFNCTAISCENDVYVLDYESGYISPVDENDDGINIEGKYRIGIKMSDDGKTKYVFNRKIQ